MRSFELGRYDERIRASGSFKSVVVGITDVGFWSRLPLSATLVHASLVYLLRDDQVDFLGHVVDAVQR